jgi:hypothetical protein
LAGSFARGFGPAQRGHKSFSWSSVRPLVDGSNRVDNFADTGGAEFLCPQDCCCVLIIRGGLMIDHSNGDGNPFSTRVPSVRNERCERSCLSDK